MAKADVMRCKPSDPQPVPKARGVFESSAYMRQPRQFNAMQNQNVQRQVCPEDLGLFDGMQLNASQSQRIQRQTYPQDLGLIDDGMHDLVAALRAIQMSQQTPQKTVINSLIQLNKAGYLDDATAIGYCL